MVMLKQCAWGFLFLALVVSLNLIRSSFSMTYASVNSQDSILPPVVDPTTIEILQNKKKNNNNLATRNMTMSTPVIAQRPPISAMIDSNGTLLADPQNLLHFAQVGHSKCGSTSFLKWFRKHPQLYTERSEVRMFENGMEDAINRLYEYPDDGRLIGYKNPSHSYHPEVMDSLRQYFPQTKLILGIRHPVLWFESFYNFRTVDKPNGRLSIARKLIGPCILDQHVCTDHARFHLQLAQLGKTPLTSPRELNLLPNNNNNNNNSHSTFSADLHRYPNPVFVYETEQLADKNETRSWQFRRDLADFLGIDQVFPKAPQIKPEKRLSSTRLEEREKFKINICKGDGKKYLKVRRVLMQHARDTADWMQEFLLESDQVVFSSRDHVHRLMESYRRDPCDERNAKLKTTNDKTPEKKDD